MTLEAITKEADVGVYLCKWKDEDEEVVVLINGTSDQRVSFNIMCEHGLLEEPEVVLLERAYNSP